MCADVVKVMLHEHMLLQCSGAKTYLE